MNIKIGAKIKALRKRDDITQERLAEVLGVTNQAISRWESETGYPDIEYISPLANFFNVTTDYLFDHDTTGKRRKIDEYCEKYDDHARNWKPAQERIDMMRQALAEFPAEEKLLMGLARALYYKWMEYGTVTDHVDGYFVFHYETHKSYDSWEEAVKIMEELLSTSLDDSIRWECYQLLAFIYARIGDNEKVLAIGEKCSHYVQSKQSILATALLGKDGLMYRQEYMLEMLQAFCDALSNLGAFAAKDPVRTTEVCRIKINLHKFVFSDGNYGYYNCVMANLYQDYAHKLILNDKLDEAFEALENAYSHAKVFDEKVYRTGEIQYTAPLINLIKMDTDKAYVSKQLPNLLGALTDTNSVFPNLHGDPRYAALISKIEADIAAEG